MRAQPAIFAIAILFLAFSANLVVGMSAHNRSAMAVVVGATGMFACAILFVIGFVVNRLK